MGECMYWANRGGKLISHLMRRKITWLMHEGAEQSVTYGWTYGMNPNGTYQFCTEHAGQFRSVLCAMHELHFQQMSFSYIGFRCGIWIFDGIFTTIADNYMLVLSRLAEVLGNFPWTTSCTACKNPCMVWIGLLYGHSWEHFLIFRYWTCGAWMLCSL